MTGAVGSNKSRGERDGKLYPGKNTAAEASPATMIKSTVCTWCENQDLRQTSTSARFMMQFYGHFHIFATFFYLLRYILARPRNCALVLQKPGE